jgi:chromate transporter
LASFLFWLKLGFISFGGPAGQIAVMHQELVEQKRWISEKDSYMHSTIACFYLALKHNNSPFILVG